MKIELVDGEPEVIGLPEGNTILFFAFIDDRVGYCVIYGPPEKCLPGQGENMSELFDAKIALGKLDQDMSEHKVSHGHKYKEGGGFAETKNAGISFFLLNDKRKSLFRGTPVQEVFIVL